MGNVGESEWRGHPSRVNIIWGESWRRYGFRDGLPTGFPPVKLVWAFLGTGLTRIFLSITGWTAPERVADPNPHPDIVTACRLISSMELSECSTPVDGSTTGNESINVFGLIGFFLCGRLPVGHGIKPFMICSSFFSSGGN